MPAGRPVKYTPEVIEDLLIKLNDYIEKNTIPIVAEFAYKNNIPRKQLYEIPEINDTLKRLIDKKEANLEKGLLSGKLVAAGAIFSLKQLGWKDRHEIDNNIKADITIIDSKILELLQKKDIS
jgi:hypothetical protein